jgi:hypothetical protein
VLRLMSKESMWSMSQLPWNAQLRVLRMSYNCNLFCDMQISLL